MEKNLMVLGEGCNKKEGVTSLEISREINKRHGDVMRDIRSILDQGVDERNFALISYTDKANRQKPCYSLTPKGMLILASGYDAKLREKLVDMVEAYHNKEKNEEINERLKQQSLIDQKIKVVSWVSDYLRLNDVSRLKLAKETVEPFGISLPDYMPSKGVYHSATYLLEQNGAQIKAHAFNQLAFANGILERMSRPSKDGEKRFWNITEKGKFYGENVSSPENPRETQPMWYDSKFKELLKELGISIQKSIFD